MEQFENTSVLRKRTPKRHRVKEKYRNEETQAAASLRPDFQNEYKSVFEAKCVFFLSSQIYHGTRMRRAEGRTFYVLRTARIMHLTPPLITPKVAKITILGSDAHLHDKNANGALLDAPLRARPQIRRGAVRRPNDERRQRLLLRHRRLSGKLAQHLRRGLVPAGDVGARDDEAAFGDKSSVFANFRLDNSQVLRIVADGDGADGVALLGEVSDELSEADAARDRAVNGDEEVARLVLRELGVRGGPLADEDVGDGRAEDDLVCDGAELPARGLPRADGDQRCLLLVGLLDEARRNRVGAERGDRVKLNRLREGVRARVRVRKVLVDLLESLLQLRLGAGGFADDGEEGRARGGGGRGAAEERETTLDRLKAI